MKKTLLILVLLICKVNIAAESKEESKEDLYSSSFILENSSDVDINICLYYLDLKQTVGKNSYFKLEANSRKRIAMFDLGTYRIYRIKNLWFVVDKDARGRRYIQAELGNLSNSSLKDKTISIYRDGEALNIKSDDLKVDISYGDLIRNGDKKEEFKKLIKAMKNNDYKEITHIAPEFINKKFELTKLPSIFMPLHYAASQNKLEIVKLLLDLGADPLEANIRGNKPIDVTKCEAIKNMLRSYENKEASK